MLPFIRISFEHRNGVSRIFLRFDYDVDLINRCKQIRARWSPEDRAWYLTDTKQNLLSLEEQFDGIAHLRWPAEFQNKRDQQAAWFAIKGHRLSEAQTEAILHLVRYLKIKGRSKSTVDTYEQLARKFFLFTQKDPKELRNKDVIYFQTDHLIKNGYANSTQRQFITTMRMLFEANDLPLLVIDKVEGPKKEQRLPKVLSRTEIMALLSCCNNLKHRTMLSLIYSSGLRISELLNLRLQDLDLDHRSMMIKQAKGKKDRLVIMGEQMAIILNNYINQFRPIDYVFNGQGNAQYSAVSVRSILKNAAKKARLNKNVTPHMLRHSFATHMIEEGVNLRYVQELLGHTRPETTQIYTHVASEHLMHLKNPFDTLMKDFHQRLPMDNNLTQSTSLSRKLRDE